MADVVNLRRVRKRKAREVQDAGAAANRLRFGRSAAERRLDEARSDIEARRLDAHKRAE